MAEAAVSRGDDLRGKLGRLSELGRRHDLRSLVIQEPATLAWLLESRVHVPQTLDSACLAVVVDLRSTPAVVVVTNAIEAPRLRDTELRGLEVEMQVLPWWQPRGEVLPFGSGVGSDRPLPGTLDIAPALAAARRRLTVRQQTLLAAVCADTAAAVGDVAERLDPAMTEYAAAGRMAEALLSRELDPIVLMVGGADRLDAHRHPLPTASRLGRRVMLVCCARRHGLVASCTRIVSFESLDQGALDRYRALLEVERSFLEATRPGATLTEVFVQGVTAYEAHGFEPDEWHRHHQGGVTGFLPREFPAHAGSTLTLDEGMAVAWNPSGQGWKVEDTCLVTSDGARPLVHEERWPVVTVGGRSRPGIWVR